MDDALTRRQLVGAGAAGAALLALRTTPAPAARAAHAARRRVRRRRRALRASPPPARSVAADRIGRRARGARPRRRAHAERARSAPGTSPRSAASTSARRRTASSRSRRRSGVKTFPTYNTGSNVLIAGGARSLYAAVPGLPDDPDVQQAILAAAKLDAPAKQAGVSAPWKAQAGQGLGPDDARRLDARPRSPARRAARSSSPPARRSGAPTRRSSRCSTSCSTRPRPATPRHPGSFLRLITTGGGAQESRFVGGSQLISEKVADRLGKRVVLQRAGAASSPRTATACASWPTARRSQARQVILAVPPALASRLAYSPALPKGKAAAAQGARPGQPDQGRGGLRSPVLARRRAQRPGRRRRRARATRSSTTRRPTARSACSSASSAAPRTRRGRSCPADQRRAQVLENLAAFVGDQARSPVGLLRAGLDQGALDARLPGRPRRPGRADEVRAVAAPRRRQGPLRRHRDRPTTGWATWTAPCARASARPGRSSRRCGADARRVPAARLVPGAPGPRRRGLPRAAHARGARRARADGPALPAGADARLRAPRRPAPGLRRGGRSGARRRLRADRAPRRRPRRRLPRAVAHLRGDRRRSAT